MSMSRDRLIRDEDPADVFLSRRRPIYVWGREELGSFPPFRWGTTSMTGTDRIEGGSGRGTIGGTIVGRRGGFNRSWGSVIGRENMSPATGSLRVGVRGRGRRSSASVLPSWYPRRPLQDITANIRGMERRSAREGEGEGLQLESPVAQDQIVHDSIASTSGAQLGHDACINTPGPTIRRRNLPVTVKKLPKLLLDITRDKAGELAFLTPQKKLLNSIEAVEKVVMEELQEWKSSPAVKKAEREKKIRILMSMR